VPIANRIATISFGVTLIGCACQAYAQDAAAWPDSLQNLTAEQGNTLLQMARDLLPAEQQADARIGVCLSRVDAAASEAIYKQGLADSVKLAGIAAHRRTGDRRYIDIANNSERVRLAKMLSEGGWLRQFRVQLTACMQVGK
jgi:hypothetical protein